jgi:phosphatidylglycerol:prolipoprotein diacylglycerol transferase
VHPLLARFVVFGVERPITTYGTLLVIAAALGVALTVRRAPARGIPGFDALACGLLGAAGGLAGASALFALVRGGFGMIFYGGLGGGVLAAWVYARAYGVALAPLADAAAPALALAHGVGRIGCFAAGCCYGRPASWGVVLHGAPRHPVQLYEAAALGALALALLLADRVRRRPGALFLLYVAGYALVRFASERWRGDDLERGFVVPGVLSISQAVAIATLAVAVALLAQRQGAR